MRYPGLESAKAAHPRLGELYDRMWDYALERLRRGDDVVVPKLAAPIIGVSNGEAFVLLEQLAIAGLFKVIYRVYCRPEGNLLATAETLDDLDHLELEHCDFCESDHKPNEVRVQIEFRTNSQEAEAHRAA